MEKLRVSRGEFDSLLTPLLHSTPNSMPSYSTRSRSRRFVLLGIAAVVIGAFYTASWVPWNVRYQDGYLNEGQWGNGEFGSTTIGNDRRAFNWSSINPSTKLTYYPCFNGFQCARLSVPLDHLDPTNPAQAHIALVKLPSTIPESDPAWGGPLLLNPGGPGASGVEFALQAGSAIHGIFDGKYSVIGFDPRGINNTIPQISCFQNSMERRVWHAKGGGRVLNSTSAATLESQLIELGEFYARATIFSKRCNEENAENVAYVGTPSTARDMRIITAAEWEGKRDDAGNPRKKGLQYWGFSYGTILGITFAAMFPDEVERIVLDGVIKAPDYYDIGWSTNLYDAEEVMDSFYEYCSLAGPLRCAFHTGNTPQDIRTRLENLLDSVKKNPVPAVLLGNIEMIMGAETPQPDLITYSDLKNVIFIALYRPLQRFPVLAELLAAVEARKPTALADYNNVFDIKPFIACPAIHTPGGGAPPDAPAPPAPPDDLHAREATPAILCSDGTPLPSTITAKDFLPYVTLLREQSNTSGDVWSQIRLSCVGWAGQAKEKPPSILTQPNPPPPGERLRPRNPILMVGTDRDPATPVRNAWVMKEWFEEEKVGILVQEGLGHCSVSSPSECAAGILKAYLEEGRLPRTKPEVGVKGEGWCGIEARPFLGRSEASGNSEGRNFVQNLETIGRAVAGLGRVGWGLPVI